MVGTMAKIDDSVKKKVPELRFPGFTDDWEERKLSDMANVKTGFPFKNENFVDDGQYLVITNGNIQNDSAFVDGKVGNRITAVTDEIKENYTLNYGDILVTMDGTVGRTAKVVEGNQILAQRVGRLVSESTPEFIYQWLNTGKVFIEMTKVSHGGTIKHISLSEIGDYVAYVPTSKDEREKIGSLFLNIDKTITLHQRKLDLLKEQKKGFLQKMFPKNGAKVPELRFAGFADDWEERKLGELSNIVGGGTPSTSNSEYWDGDIDWYAPAEFGEQRYVSKSKKTITELGLKKSSARILPVGTVLFTSRAGIGNTAILGKEATTNQGFQSIVPNPNKLDSYFIYSRTNELKRYGEVTGAGSTFVEVSGKQMSKMSIMVPELSEQKKIGSFFEQLDNTIALHQRKLDLLKEQKKGYLQKMFV